MRLDRFGDYEFQKWDVTDSIGATPAGANWVSTPGLSFDAADDNALDHATTGVITRGTTLHAATAETLQPLLDAARALRGTKAKLWARTYDDTVRWKWATCKQVAIQRTARNFNWQPVTFTFDVDGGHWHGHDYADWTLDDTPQVYLDEGYYLDDTSFTFTPASGATSTVTNGGNVTTHDVRITVTAGSSSITACTLAWGNTDIDFAGTVATGNDLVIDGGLWTVTNDGVDAYAGITLAGGHAMPQWFALAPGDNEIVLTYTGGGTGTDLLVEFEDAWA